MIVDERYQGEFGLAQFVVICRSAWSSALSASETRLEERWTRHPGMARVMRRAVFEQSHSGLGWPKQQYVLGHGHRVDNCFIPQRFSAAQPILDGDLPGATLNFRFGKDGCPVES